MFGENSFGPRILLKSTTTFENLSHGWDSRNPGTGSMHWGILQCTASWCGCGRRNGSLALCHNDLFGVWWGYCKPATTLKCKLAIQASPPHSRCICWLHLQEPQEPCTPKRLQPQLAEHGQLVRPAASPKKQETNTSRLGKRKIIFKSTDW